MTAIAALAAGVPVKVVSQRLGHADITVTLKVYAHMMPGDDEAAAAITDGLLAIVLLAMSCSRLSCSRFRDQSVTTGPNSV